MGEGQYFLSLAGRLGKAAPLRRVVGLGWVGLGSGRTENRQLIKKREIKIVDTVRAIEVKDER